DTPTRHRVLASPLRWTTLRRWASAKNRLARPPLGGVGAASSADEIDSDRNGSEECAPAIVDGSRFPRHLSLFAGNTTRRDQVFVASARDPGISRLMAAGGEDRPWQSGEMALRWTAAGMLEAERQFRRIIGYGDLAKLVVAIER